MRFARIARRGSVWKRGPRTEAPTICANRSGERGGNEPATRREGAGWGRGAQRRHDHANWHLSPVACDSLAIIPNPPHNTGIQLGESTMSATLIKPTHKSLSEYHATLAQLADQNAPTEGNLRRAFSHLLATTAKLHDWTLVEEDTRAPSTAPGTAIRTDGTLYDRNRLPRGYWEAKDPSDDLAAEIRKKKARGYSLMNTIFEDTRTAVLFQNIQEVQRADLANPEQLSGLLNAFYAQTEPDFQHWEEAVEDFKDRVALIPPRLAIPRVQSTWRPIRILYV